MEPGRLQRMQPFALMLEVTVLEQSSDSSREGSCLSFRRTPSFEFSWVTALLLTWIRGERFSFAAMEAAPEPGGH